MLRFDDCLCGTTTTGTGTLTLAAIPSGAGGGIDPDVWARATGVGFANSAAFLVDYVITEYTDATFATESKKEAGTGTLTLGGSSGIANVTLARTTIDYTLTSLNSQPASANVKPGTGITIGTAANTLVSIVPRSLSLQGFHPYYESSAEDSNWGVLVDGGQSVTSPIDALGFVAGSNFEFYLPIRLSVPMLVKRLSFRINTRSSPTGTPVVYAGIYDFGTNGRPSKLLYDFTGASPVSITSTGNFSTSAAGNGVLLTPGDYFVDLALTGLTTGSVILAGGQPYQGSSLAAVRLGAVGGRALPGAYASSPTTGARPDPANVTGYGLLSFANSNQVMPLIGLGPS